MEFTKLVVTVMRTRTQHDPPLTVYEALVTDGDREWRETYGSLEKLQGFLTGIQLTLSMAGIPAHLSWHIPESWGEPCGMRWTIAPGMLTKMEELSSSGKVIEV